MKVREHDNISIPATSIAKNNLVLQIEKKGAQIGSEETIVMAFMFDMLLMSKWSCAPFYWIELISHCVTINFYSCLLCYCIHMFNPSIVPIQWIAFFHVTFTRKKQKKNNNNSFGMWQWENATQQLRVISFSFTFHWLVSSMLHRRCYVKQWN